MDNILKEIKSVSWKTLSGSGTFTAGGVLELHSSQRRKIEKEYTTDYARIKAGINYWIWNHPYASWRNLITKLDEEKEHAVANKLRLLAEKLTGMLSSYLYYY